MGLTAVASRRHGERRREEAAGVVGDTLIYALLLGGAVAVGGTSIPALLAAIHTPASVSALSTAYLGTYLLGAP